MKRQLINSMANSSTALVESFEDLTVVHALPSLEEVPPQRDQ